MWAPGGFRPDAEEQVEAVGPGTNATTLVTGTKWLENASSGPLPPRGYAFPMDIAYVEPEDYARVIAEPGLLSLLDRDTIVFGESAQRTAKGILSVQLDGVGYTARSLVPDEQIQGYEAVLAAPAPPGWGASFLLVRTPIRKSSLGDVARRLSDRPVAVVQEGDTTYLRYAHSTTPYVFFKDDLGEFAARPRPDGSLEIDPSWVKQKIVSKAVPLIGRVRCNEEFIPQLTAALRTIQGERLARFLKVEQYAGCYNPRFIGRDPDGRLSAHAWGAAVDLNAAENPLGQEPAMHPRVVQAFLSAGFVWGGDWMIPDGMHFEWARSQGA